MKILVISQDYPSAARPYAQTYVHTRSRKYAELGHDVQAISFSCVAAYDHEGVPVAPATTVGLDNYDVIAVHAANLRNHMRALHGISGQRIVFFWHGHEVLRATDYPPPYEWARRRVRDKAKSIYDELKLPVLSWSLSRLAKTNRIGFVFVSESLKRLFRKTMGSDALAMAPSKVISNGCYDGFLKKSHRPSAKSTDIVSIRPLDERKYAVDLVVEMAAANPNRNFHLYGKGRFFEHVRKPSNLTHHAEFIPQPEIPALLDRFSAALLPTWQDTQGVMACEMATYGIPLVTTDIPIAREMVGSFANVRCFPPEDFAQPFDFDSIPSGPDLVNRHRFDQTRLAREELEFFDA